MISTGLLNFGSDMSGIIGYYRAHFFVAGEAGFDKAIVTHFKHSENTKISILMSWMAGTNLQQAVTFIMGYRQDFPYGIRTSG